MGRAVQSSDEVGGCAGKGHETAVPANRRIERNAITGKAIGIHADQRVCAGHQIADEHITETIGIVGGKIVSIAGECEASSVGAGTGRIQQA